MLVAQVYCLVTKDVGMCRKIAFIIIIASGVIFISLSFFELAVRFVNPQQTLYPRYIYSARYGHWMPESAAITDEKSGAYKFVYDTNEYGFRVSMPPISNHYDRANIVLLGDSNTFGLGVNDGEEFGALLAKKLDTDANVVNLGVPGFGLTNEIRVFYEFGRLFEPDVVVLVFCSNDPDDNFYERVTTVSDGRFRFDLDQSMNSSMAGIKTWLSGSVIQKSAVYNFVRTQLYTYWRNHVVGKETSGEELRKEAFHNELLVAFAQDLRHRGIRLMLLAPPGDLAAWPGILNQVKILDHQGLLDYQESEKWFVDISNYGSPEGHPWGVLGHQIVAERLIDPMRAALKEAKSMRVAKDFDRSTGATQH